MNDVLTGKTVLVTGASRGLGRAVALAFVNAGAKVIAMGRDAEALKQTVSLVPPGRGTIHPVALDLCDEQAVVSEISKLQTLDILINNAGVAAISPMLDTSTEQLRAMFEVNVFGAFTVMREAAKKMTVNGHIINIASDAALHGIAQMAPYVASKHALLGLSRSAQMELEPKGIRVTAFCPGPIATDILGSISNSPAAMPPDEVAMAILHLATMPESLAIREVLIMPRPQK